MSVSSTGAQGNNTSFDPSFSANGRYVAFPSNGTNLVRAGADTNGAMDVFVRDLVAGSTRRVSLTNSGGQANDPSFRPTISGDGRYVAFASEATNLVPGDTNGVRDVFVRDLVGGRTYRASLNSTGGQTNGDSDSASISSDGRHVAFTSLATNLVRAGADTNGVLDVFVRDLLTASTRRASLSSAGGQANEYSAGPSISADGRYVAFESAASNLVPGDTYGKHDVFRRDLVTGCTRRVNLTSTGGRGNGDGYESLIDRPSISGDGRYVAFTSDSTNLVPGDTNASRDIFVRDTIG